MVALRGYIMKLRAMLITVGFIIITTIVVMGCQWAENQGQVIQDSYQQVDEILQIK